MNVVVFGATGAVGNALVKNLLDDHKVTKIYLLTRRQTLFQNESKVSEVIIPEMSIERILDLEVKCDHYICTLGTTIKKAKTKDKFRFVDHDLVIAFARFAKKMDAKSFHIISSMGSDSSSLFFYNKTKGEMEESLIKLKLESLYIYRPSLLITKRDDFRLGEKIGITAVAMIKPLMGKKLGSLIGTKVTTLSSNIISNIHSIKKGLSIIDAREII
jgi:uncharacterized protein YbjT (DUF2867 family)